MIVFTGRFPVLPGVYILPVFLSVLSCVIDISWSFHSCVLSPCRFLCLTQSYISGLPVLVLPSGVYEFMFMNATIKHLSNVSLPSTEFGT